MFGIAVSEYLLIIIVAVLVLGPEHLPKVLHTLAKLVANFRRIVTEVQLAINIESLEDESFLHTTTGSYLKKKKTKNTSKKTQTSNTVTSSQQTNSFQCTGTSQQDSGESQQMSLPKNINTIPYDRDNVFGKSTSLSECERIASSSNIDEPTSIENDKRRSNANTINKLKDLHHQESKDLS